MKKEYTSPQFDYWCYISDKLCDGVSAALYANAKKAPLPPMKPSSASDY